MDPTDVCGEVANEPGQTDSDVDWIVTRGCGSLATSQDRLSAGFCCGKTCQAAKNIWQGDYNIKVFK